MDEAVPAMPKPPQVEAARVFRTVWSGHMPKGSASGFGSGIMVEMMVGALLIMTPI
jgi:hypothetical protein